MEIAVMTKLMELADEIRALSKQTRESIMPLAISLLEAKSYCQGRQQLPALD